MRFITLILFFYFPFATLSQDTEEKKNNLNLPGYLKLNFGFTFLEDNNHSLQTDIFPSRSLDIFYSKPIFLGDNFSINPGLGISNDRLSFSNDITLTEITDIDGISQIIVDTLSYSPDKNSLKGTYLMVPVDFKYYFGSGSLDKRRFFIGIGAEFGFLLNSSTKVKQTIFNIANTTKAKKDFGLNDFKYGVSFQIGVGNFNIYYKKHLSNLFDSNSLPLYENNNPTINKVGISFSLF